MELKHALPIAKSSAISLLIVPYGIETCTAGFNAVIGNSLLIVPYGIETLTGEMQRLQPTDSFNRTLWN